jgi:DNA replication protein DnaC
MSCPLFSVESLINEQENDKTVYDISSYLEQTNIPIKFNDACLSDDNDRIIKFCKEISDNITLVLIGDFGRGKTYLACASMNHRRDNGLNAGKFISCKYEVCPMIRTCRNFKSDMQEYDVMKRYYTVPYLVIDEVGQGDDPAIEKVFVSNILSARYDNALRTVITTNMDMKNLCTFLGGAIMSRFFETADTVILNGEDRRKLNDGA